MPPDDAPDFEWDPNKAWLNQTTHGVSFDEAKTVYNDPLAASEYDEEHSWDEDRYVTIGLTDKDRLCVVVHTPRGSRMRLISAREAEPAEIRDYEQGQS